MLSQEPLNLQLYLDLARNCLREKRLQRMADVLQRSLEVYPTLQAYRTLGDIMMQERDARASLAYYEKMDGFAQGTDERLQNRVALCFAYAEAGELQKATDGLMAMLKERPTYTPALRLLEEVRKRQAQQTAPH